MAIGRYAPASGSVGDGKVLIAGGYHEGDGSLQSAELFNPATNGFEALGPGHEMLEKREEAAHVTRADGDLLLLGGYNQTSKVLRTAELFNWESQTFERVAPELTEPRYGPAAALLSDGRVLIAGGYDSVYLATAELAGVSAPALSAAAATAISSVGASLTASASSEAPLSAYFQYGTTSDYGSETAKQPVGASNRALPFTASVSGLASGTTYHFRAVTENGAGTVYGPDQTFTTVSVAPSITGLTQSHRRWRAGSKAAHLSSRAPRGTVFSFVLSQQASVTLAFTQPATGRRVKGHCVALSHRNRGRAHCSRVITRARLIIAGKAGPNRLAFQGPVSSSRRLSPGTYTVVITATNSAKLTSAPKRLTFTILR